MEEGHLMEAFFANLPFVLLLLVCPLSMIFMMRMGAHGGRGGDHDHHDHFRPAEKQMTDRP